MTIPTWALPLVLTLFLAVLGFAWRLAVRAERLTDKLETLVERMTTIETRLAAVTALETAVAEIRAEARALRSEIAHARELTGRDLEALCVRLETAERRLEAHHSH